MPGVHLGIVVVGLAFGRTVVAGNFFLEVIVLPRSICRGGRLIIETNRRDKRLEFAVGECARLNFHSASEIGPLGRQRPKVTSKNSVFV